MRPLLVIDVQPAYCAAHQGWQLARDVLERMELVPADVPVVVVSVNEELSGDTPAAVQEFWLDAGMTDEQFERITFLEKPYAFFRSWMDCGVPESEIVAVAKRLRKRNLYDSRDLPGAILRKLAPRGFELDGDMLGLPYELETEPVYKQPHWDICGGGRDACLHEMELWFDSNGIGYTRLESLIYD